MSVDYLLLLRRVDRLYEDAVTVPAAWDDGRLVDWLAACFEDGYTPSKETARSLRRCVRSARKLRDFWADRLGDGGGADWRSRVDQALGARAWRPPLELARIGLAESPSEALFEEVRTRFRVVHSERWMEGVTYDEWVALGHVAG